MKILSHRGYWKKNEEKNTLNAFERSFRFGFGAETDLRDYKGEIVVSHDIADGNCIRAEELFECYTNYKFELPIALNIKADGLQYKLKELLLEFRIENYFVFDMSIPDTLGYISSKLRYFTRESEYEPKPVFYEESAGVWMDCFKEDWIAERDIAQHLSVGKQVCLVSPDLHGRDPKAFWENLSKMALVSTDRLLLCTDYPREALEFFYGKN